MKKRIYKKRMDEKIYPHGKKKKYKKHKNRKIYVSLKEIPDSVWVFWDCGSAGTGHWRIEKEVAEKIINDGFMLDGCENKVNDFIITDYNLAVIAMMGVPTKIWIHGKIGRVYDRFVDLETKLAYDDYAEAVKYCKPFNVCRRMY